MRLEADVGMIQLEYLRLFFRYPTYWDIVKTNVFGATQPNVNGTKVSEFNVPIPNLETQKRIVDEISSLSDRVTILKKGLRNILSFWESVKASILDSALQGRL
ncbi:MULTISPECIES: restriction endonuclease subunit S [Acinetobacter calcoaceticus/baumannii complex]|uniref:restriction endonuclease subunit S n=1 Tax=Acinetobacter calcoaceticus/baumannii complex TaxID=909768 RepID=UPI000FB5DE0B|nr:MULTISPECIES: restriction endonuclease subunit S [Acinetobacter calcoaceticus/baumannii complex]QRF07237.1 restriction endonuclease subunit S [Acinetobacter pittii]RUT42779.1 type I restriction endonuclease subunit S [Acinetobacter baumannii]